MIWDLKIDKITFEMGKKCTTYVLYSSVFRDQKGVYCIGRWQVQYWGETLILIRSNGRLHEIRVLGTQWAIPK